MVIGIPAENWTAYYVCISKNPEGYGPSAGYLPMRVYIVTEFAYSLTQRLDNFMLKLYINLYFYFKSTYVTHPIVLRGFV